ncbi:hypothetical protein D3C74_298460 [compost metagenome]
MPGPSHWIRSTPDPASVAVSVTSTLDPRFLTVATVTGAVASTLSSRVASPTLPDASVARAATVRTPSVSTVTGPVYAAQAPPSTETSTAGAGSRLSLAATVTRTGSTYQPEVAGPGSTDRKTVGAMVSSASSGATTNTVASAGRSVPSTSPSTKKSPPASAYCDGSTASHSTPVRLSREPSSNAAVTLDGKVGAVPASVTTLT